MTASDRHDDPSNGPGGNSIHRDGANVRRKAQRHALIVDDDGLFAKSLARMLAALGCVAKVTPSGSDALAYLQANPVDLIFSDLQMPGMNGLDFIERAREAGVAAPFVLMTGGAGPRDIVLALRLGAVDCLLKPFDRAELIEVMARALGGVGPPAAVASDPETAPMPTPPVPPPSQPALRPAGPPSPPTPTSTPSAAPGPSPLEPDLRARVELAVEHDTLDLPFPAAALQQLLELNADLEPSAHELAAIVREVPTMASMVIRMGGGSVPPQPSTRPWSAWAPSAR